MKSRSNIGEHLTSLGLINKGVEVGVFKGEFSKEILSKWEGTLYMVDPWFPSRYTKSREPSSNKSTACSESDLIIIALSSNP